MINIIQNNFDYDKRYQLNKVQKIEPAKMHLGCKDNRNEKKDDNREVVSSSDSLPFNEVFKRVITKTK